MTFFFFSRLSDKSRSTFLSPLLILRNFFIYFYNNSDVAITSRAKIKTLDLVRSYQKILSGDYYTTKEGLRIFFYYNCNCIQHSWFVYSFCLISSSESPLKFDGSKSGEQATLRLAILSSFQNVIATPAGNTSSLPRLSVLGRCRDNGWIFGSLLCSSLFLPSWRDERFRGRISRHKSRSMSWWIFSWKIDGWKGINYI